MGTIIWITSSQVTQSVSYIRMKLFLVLTAVTIIIAQRELDSREKRQRLREFQSRIQGSGLSRASVDDVCQSWYEITVGTVSVNESMPDCTVQNQPGGILAVLQSNGFQECSQKCLGFEQCKFWTMREDNKQCWLFGFTNKFSTVGPVYIS